MSQEFAIGHLLIGPLMILISYIFAKYPPKKINDLYGYRTKRSMHNLDCWDFANRHSILLMWKISLLTCVVQAIGLILLNERVALLTTTIVLIATLIYSVYLTEKALKKNSIKKKKDYENHLYWKELLRAC